MLHQVSIGVGRVADILHRDWVEWNSFLHAWGGRDQMGPQMDNKTYGEKSTSLVPSYIGYQLQLMHEL